MQELGLISPESHDFKQLPYSYHYNPLFLPFRGIFLKLIYLVNFGRQDSYSGSRFATLAKTEIIYP